MSKFTIAAFALTFSMIPGLASACTVEDLQAKALEASTAMQQLAATDPAKMQTIALELSQIQQDALSAGSDFSAFCTLYDDLIAEING
ncbi:MAG: hypothetical protein AAF590_03740 [Pseudomonadota bacterium]